MYANMPVICTKIHEKPPEELKEFPWNFKLNNFIKIYKE
jgi:hypothetical protein